MSMRSAPDTQANLTVEGAQDLEVGGSTRSSGRRGARGGTRTKSRWVLLLQQLGLGVLIVLAWQGLVSLDIIDPLVARSPQEVAAALWTLISGSEFWPHFASTLSAMLIAFALASVVGVIVGVLLGLLPRTQRVVEPYLSFFNSIPRTAFAPIFLVYFGIGQNSKIALAFTIVVFVMIVNARAGVLAVDRDIVTMARTVGMSKRQMFVKVLLPGAVPSIFAGLWLGVIYALLGVVTSEIIASKEGVGQLVARASDVFALESVYALVIILGLVGMVLNTLMGMAERYFLRWQR